MSNSTNRTVKETSTYRNDSIKGTTSSTDSSTKDSQVKELSLQSGLTLMGAFLAFFCSVGFANAWGIFQEWYKAHQLHSKSEFDISWLGSFCIFAMYITSPAAGIAYDRIGPQLLLCIGSILCLVAIFMTSLCDQYYQFFLAQALLLGVSFGFLITPSLSSITRYFKKNRALGMGIVVAGSSTGGVVWPIVLNQFLNHTDLGFGWSVRIVGFIMMLLLLCSCLIVRAPPSPASEPEKAENQSDEDSLNTRSSKKPKTDISILKRPAFIFSVVGLGIANLGMLTPLFYISSYGASLGLSTSFTFYLVSIANGASFFGRVIPGILADQYGCFNLLFSATLGSGVVAFCMTAAEGKVGVAIWSAAFGLTSGAIMSLQSACISHLATPETMGTAMGLAMGCISIMVLFGAPIAGQLVGQYGYLAFSMFAGSTLVAGSLLIATARLSLDRRVFVVR